MLHLDSFLSHPLCFLFQSYIDVMMDGAAAPTTVRADISANPNSDPFTGAGSIDLDASGSIGEGLEYFWTIAANAQSFYSIADDDAASTSLLLADPTPAQYVMITHHSHRHRYQWNNGLGH